MRVHLAVEHSLELEAANLVLEPLRVFVDVLRGSLVTFRFRELEELRGIRDPFRSALDLACIGFQACPLTAELLRTLGLAPDGGILQLAAYLLEAFLLVVVLKETPVRSGCAPRDL
jgi:hypothetical protein